jgi:hypothetical protein
MTGATDKPQLQTRRSTSFDPLRNSKVVSGLIMTYAHLKARQTALRGG